MAVGAGPAAFPLPCFARAALGRLGGQRGGGGGGLSRPRLAGGAVLPAHGQSRAVGQARGLGRRRAGRGGLRRRRGRARGGGRVPAWTGAAGGGGGRLELRGARAALGLAEAAHGEAQGRLATRAGGGRRVPRRRGGESTAAAPIRVGNKSGSRRRPRLSSPWARFRRRRAGRGSSMERGGAQRRTSMAAVVCGLYSARDGVDRGRERVE
jgi:hypothetical protein